MELTHLVGVLRKCDRRFLVISFCFGVKEFIQSCAKKMCVKSHADLDPSRGSYFYHSRKENKVTIGSKAKAGLNKEARCLSSWGLGTLVSLGVPDWQGGCGVVPS